MRRFLMTVCLFINVVFSQVLAADSKKIILATDDWLPYVSKAQPGKGKFAEIVSMVFKEMGLEVEYLFVPWKRAETLVKNGDVFAALPYSYTDERYKIFDFSVPLMESRNVFFYMKKNFPHGINYLKLEDLARYRINGVTGYWYEGLFAKAHLPVDYVTMDEQGIHKLFKNRVDLVATDELVGWALVKKLYPNEIEQFAVVSKPFEITHLHLLISRKYPNAKAITEKFNLTFKALQDKSRQPSL